MFLTESSTKLLSKKISTSLKGRSLAIEIWLKRSTYIQDALQCSQVAILTPPQQMELSRVLATDIAFLFLEIMNTITKFNLR